ncbi:diacylglycerol kinase theta-like isoform X3 [Lineus longissimus]|uniref:diacylglycerol kinase theta-like isoform X3 n=1 Tax=Lineus longissimus TaxID=88925 RepID=UPI002B4F3E77
MATAMDNFDGAVDPDIATMYGRDHLEFNPGHGHFFVKKTFHKPTYCHHCTDMLWGLIGQGYVCEVCNFVVHDRCVKTVVSPCSSIAVNLIKNPVAHCWSEPAHFKRKFCNVCRKRLEDSWAIRCEICEYYAHLDCQDFVVSDCKECTTYSPNKQNSAPQYHHWREGNLPGNSKCIVCKKTCWSSECLAGMRCEWCGVTAHATCYKTLPVECNFGILRDIMLPPNSVSLPRLDNTQISMETIIGLSKKASVKRSKDDKKTIGATNSSSSEDAATPQTTERGHRSKSPEKTPSSHRVSEEWSSSGDSKNEEDGEKRSPKEKDGKERDRDEELIRLYDGNAALKKRQYRTIAINRNAPVSQAVEAALKTFQICDSPKNFCLTEIIDKDGNEVPLDPDQPLRNQIQTEGRRPSLFLRYKDMEANRTFIKTYPGVLSNNSKVKELYKYIPVSKDTTAQDAVHLTIRKFKIDDADPNAYSLVQVLLDKGVTEHVLAWNDRPWAIINNVRKDSLRQYKMTRFYLRQTEDPHGPCIALFVGRLKDDLSQRQYEKILLDILGRELRWSSIDAIYYEYGGLVLLFDNPEKAAKAFHCISEASFEDKQLMVLLLPYLQPHLMPEHFNPLLVFVNVKSGGCQGYELVTAFRKLLNPHQVFNLDFGGPLPGLYVFRHVPYYKILVCGGDGTVGWTLSCLDNVGQDAKCQSPPLAIVPLGTGNDLARVLRWGPGYSGAEDPLNLLRDVIDAETISLDRWTVIFHQNEKEADETKMYLDNEMSTATTSEDSTSIFVMNNYFGIGIDADLCLDFHMAREENPDKFNSRLHNKSVYFKMGLRKMVNRKSCKDLHRMIKVEVDGKLITLPPVEGIIILNILSWGSGANPWGPEREDIFTRPNHYDGQLEVVGVSGVVHMGQIQSGLRSGTRIAQGGHLRITLLTDLPVQVDGEPWVQPAGQVVVLRSALKATMLKKSKNKIKRRNTEPSIFFPNSESLTQSPDAESGPL